MIWDDLHGRLHTNSRRIESDPHRNTVVQDMENSETKECTVADTKTMKKFDRSLRLGQLRIASLIRRRKAPAAVRTGNLETRPQMELIGIASLIRRWKAPAAVRTENPETRPQKELIGIAGEAGVLQLPGLVVVTVANVESRRVKGPIAHDSVPVALL